MTCCGRSSLPRPSRPRPGLPRPPTPVRRPTAPAPDRTAVLFEYLGRSRLEVRGPVTRRIYRFVGEGAIRHVDPRDARGLDTVPRLRRKGG